MRDMPINMANIKAVQLYLLLPVKNIAVIVEKAAVVWPEGKLLSLSICCPIMSQS